MTHIERKISVDVSGLRPRDMKIRQGFNVTLSVAFHQVTREQVLLLGIIDSKGIETAVPINKASAMELMKDMQSFIDKM